MSFKFSSFAPLVVEQIRSVLLQVANQAALLAISANELLRLFIRVFCLDSLAKSAMRSLCRRESTKQQQMTHSKRVVHNTAYLQVYDICSAVGCMVVR